MSDADAWGLQEHLLQGPRTLQDTGSGGSLR